MRFLPGMPSDVAHESISSRMLIDQGINAPDFVPTIFRLWGEESPLMQFLDIKGLKTHGLNFETNDKNYRTVGSNHIQYRINATDMRKERFKANVTGATFVCDAYPTTPGKNQSEIVFYLDSNWAGYHEILELADNTTQIMIMGDPEPDDNNAWKYTGKIVGNDLSEYVDTTLLNEGQECVCIQSLDIQDFSERGVEKYTFQGWGDAYLSLQRFKYSWSGTAKAMKSSDKRWVEHNGEKTFLSYAEMEMFRRAAKYINYQLIHGKQTVTTDTKKVILKNEKGQDVLAGNGIMNSGEGSLNIPYNGFSKEFITSLLTEIDSYITPGEDGMREALMMSAPRASMEFQRTMAEMGVTHNNNIVGDGASKGINDSYSYYEIDGIRLVNKRYSGFSNVGRPGIMLADGTYNNEHDAIIVPIGKTASGNRNIELVQLRPMASGTVAGIDEGGNIASSVDGSQKHILFQNGVISQGQTFRLTKPYPRN